MSRVVWGHGPEKSDGYRQTVLRFPSVHAGGSPPPDTTPLSRRALKREATEEGVGATRAGDEEARARAPPQPPAALDAGILYGPSGGSNRETMRRRPMFMNGEERSAIYDQSPYSRASVSQWMSDRRRQEGTSQLLTTNMDDEIIARAFLAPDCPRDLFQGQVFFLNSCDSDPLVTSFQLEKIIRMLGGSTAMGPSGKVAYVVTQHLSYAKEEKVRAALARGAAKRLPYKLVHPHFILECAKRGRLVATGPFETQVASQRPLAAQAPTGSGDASVTPRASTEIALKRKELQAVTTSAAAAVVAHRDCIDVDD